MIGRGLIGSAAARHLATAGQEVLLVGPDEPQNKAGHRGVFGSHYDEGRITRRIAVSPFWTRVSAASIARYDRIATESGIAFFTRCGALLAGPRDHPFILSAGATRQAEALATEELDARALAARFPFFAFGPDHLGYYEADTGHVSPRRLVAAQTEAARRRGAEVVPAVVRGIAETAQGVVLATDQGRYQADAALIAAGAMTDHLSPRPPRMRVYARTASFFEVTPAEAARLADMPSLLFRVTGPSEPYLLPPIRYPDGRLWLKLGGDPVDVVLETPEAIGDWFRSGGNPDVRDFQEAMLRRLMPDLAIESVGMTACVTMFTAIGNPVIDRVSDRIAVATGGNGQGAKCSDELGRLGAQVVAGGPVPEDTCFIEGELT